MPVKKKISYIKQIYAALIIDTSCTHCATANCYIHILYFLPHNNLKQFQVNKLTIQTQDNAARQWFKTKTRPPAQLRGLAQSS